MAEQPNIDMAEQPDIAKQHDMPEMAEQPAAAEQPNIVEQPVNAQQAKKPVHTFAFLLTQSTGDESQRKTRTSDEIIDQDISPFFKDDGPTDLLCIICDNEGPKICNGCKTARYCSAECQRDDWPMHKHLCADLPKFSEHHRPSGRHFRAVLFPVYGDKPELIWVQYKVGTGMLTIEHPDLDKFAQALGHETIPISSSFCGFIPVGTLFGKRKMDHGVAMLYVNPSSATTQPEFLNKSLAALGKPGLLDPVFGPLIQVSFAANVDRKLARRRYKKELAKRKKGEKTPEKKKREKKRQRRQNHLKKREQKKEAEAKRKQEEEEQKQEKKDQEKKDQEKKDQEKKDQEKKDQENEFGQPAATDKETPTDAVSVEQSVTGLAELSLEKSGDDAGTPEHEEDQKKEAGQPGGTDIKETDGTNASEQENADQAEDTSEPMVTPELTHAPPEAGQEDENQDDDNQDEEAQEQNDKDEEKQNDKSEEIEKTKDPNQATEDKTGARDRLRIIEKECNEGLSKIDLALAHGEMDEAASIQAKSDLADQMDKKTIDYLKKLKHNPITMACSSMRDYRSFIYYFQNRRANPAVPFHSASPFQCIPMIRIADLNDPFNQAMEITQSPEPVWVTIHHPMNATLAWTLAFLVGLPWYIRDGETIDPPREWKGISTRFFERRTNLVAIGDVISNEKGQKRQAFIATSAGHAYGGSFMVMHVKGIPISGWHVLALNEYFGFCMAIKQVPKKEAFEKYWEVYKTKEMKKGNDIGEVGSPYDPDLVHGDSFDDDVDVVMKGVCGEIRVWESALKGEKTTQIFYRVITEK